MSGGLPRSGAVLGIDVGWSPVRRSSAACLLWWTGRAVGWQADRFRAAEPERCHALVRLAGGRLLQAVAIDGPLDGRPEVMNRYRSAEALLTLGLARLIGKPGASSTPTGRLLNAHANACAALVLDRLDIAPARHPEAIRRRAVVEAFPSSFLGAMLPDPGALPAKRGRRSDVYYRALAADGTLLRLIADLLPGRVPAQAPAAITDHDERAALACALTALGLAAGRYTAVGDPRDGWIILPARAHMQPAVAELLQANLARVPAGRIAGPDWPGTR